LCLQLYSSQQRSDNTQVPGPFRTKDCCTLTNKPMRYLRAVAVALTSVGFAHGAATDPTTDDALDTDSSYLTRYKHFVAHNTTQTCTTDDHFRPFNNQIRGVNMGTYVICIYIYIFIYTRTHTFVALSAFCMQYAVWALETLRTDDNPFASGFRTSKNMNSQTFSPLHLSHTRTTRRLAST
jgi:hypothetical protein